MHVRAKHQQKCLLLQDLKLGFSENTALPMLHQVMVVCEDETACMHTSCCFQWKLLTCSLCSTSAGCNAAVHDHL